MLKADLRRPVESILLDKYLNTDPYNWSYKHFNICAKGRPIEAVESIYEILV